MPDYQWAVDKGKIVTADYDRSMALNADQVKSEIEKAFSNLFEGVDISAVSDEFKEVYKVTIPKADGIETVYVCAKGTTPGGRSNLQDEQRIQQKAKYLNYAFDKKAAGEKAICVGVYKHDSEPIFCAWNLNQSTAGPETPISKQIKIKTIARALTEGFVQQMSGSGQYVCAFRSDFIYFYLANSGWIHTNPASQLNNNNDDAVEQYDDTDVSESLDPKDQKERFKIWMSSQLKANGEPYSTNTIASYIGQMERGYAEFEKYHEYESVFQIQDADELKEYTDYLFNADGFDEFNEKAGNKACSNGFVKYGQFLAEENAFSTELVFDTSVSSDKARNRIIFGAPGTGKSFSINKERKELLGEDNETDYERVTFHPDYSYANFVGTYKPVPFIDSEGKDAITYEYVPGPFMRVYVNALKSGRTDSPKPYLLIIEEINRANVAAVFGDVFQLLDRDNRQVSEYPIQASEDIKKYLAKKLGGELDNYSKIRIPNNMFIWATMNSADQGVFPMDTAFKRRWDFTYIGINDNDDDLKGKTVEVGSKIAQRVEWNKLRMAINDFLAKQKINEDKQLGPYFISRDIVVPDGPEIDKKRFADVFKSKVIMYLFEDAAKQKRATLFEGCFQNSSRYSEICKEFDEHGIGIFNHDIVLAADPEDTAGPLAGTMPENE